jgi:CRISPR-associated endoribonuclease Cas6
MFPFSGQLQYNFSGIKGQSKVTSDGLFFDSPKVTIVFSSLNENFVNSFVDALFEYQEVRLGTMLLKPFQVFREVVSFDNKSVKYICLSPLVPISDGLPKDEIKKFIPPDSETFSDLLYDSTLTRMEKSELFSNEDIKLFSDFYFEPEKDYMAKTKLHEKKFSRIYHTNNKGTQVELRGYTLPFLLSAHPKVHEFIFHSGFGEVTQEGFGMIDFAERARSTFLVNHDFNWGKISIG